MKSGSVVVLNAPGIRGRAELVERGFAGVGESGSKAWEAGGGGAW